MAYITKKTTVDGIKPIGSNLYGTCSTASGTATKTVSMPDFNVLVEGVTIHVYFQNENTADAPTLKVGSTSAQPIRHNGQAGGSWEAGGFISFTYYNGSWHQNDITIAGVTYTFSISGHTMTISGSDGSVQTITLPDNNTTYTLSKSGSTITLTGSDGSTTSVTDDNTTYSGMTQAQGEAGTSTTKMVISPKVLHDVIEALDDDTTYSIGISGHTITLTPSEGTPQSVTVPDNNTTYTISKSGNTVTLTGSDGSTQTFTDSDTTYSAGTGLQLSGTTFSVKLGYTTSGNNRKVQADANGNLYVVQKDNNTTYTAGTGLELDGTQFKAKLGYTTSGNNRKVQADSSGNLYVVQKDNNTTYTAGTGLDLDGTEFNHSNSVTAVTTESLRKIKYDAQGHITGSSAVAKADITALGIPGDDTNNRRGFYGTCTTAAATAAKVVTLGNTAGWELVAGTIVGVKFSYTNTASNPTLNVNSSGAKSIIYNTGTITTSNLNKAGYANRIEYYMYDGSHWVWIGWSVDDNTWQSNTNARAGYVASGADQINKVWKTDDNGSPAWREETKYPIYIATGTADATTSLSNGVITKIPLTVTGTNLSGNVGSTLSLNSTARAIKITGEGLYRITASVYIRPAVNAMIGAYIMYNTDSTSFSDAVEGASSLSYATTTGGAVNITQTIDVPRNSTVYVFLCGRTVGTTGTAFNDNQATFLEVEQVR